MIIAGLSLVLLSLNQPSKCDLTTTLITSRSVGALRIGEAARDLRRRCPSIRDTVVATGLIDSPDTLVKALVVTMADAPVIVHVEDGRVVSLVVTRAGPKTSAGLGVGTSVARFRTLTGVAIGEDDHHSNSVPTSVARWCGISFNLSGWGPAPPLEYEGVLHVRHELDQWPDSIHVTRVIVFGCGK